MITKFIEATDGTEFNYGKFMVGRFSPEEWKRTAAIHLGTAVPLLRQCGWGGDIILVMDLQTGEGILVAPHGSARADLNQQHQVWVCPMFEPFLIWLYKQDLTDLEKLPDMVNLGNVPTALSGYRRTGKANG